MTQSLDKLLLTLLLALGGGCTQASTPKETSAPAADIAPSSAFKWVAVGDGSAATAEAYPARVLITAGGAGVVVPPLPARIVSLAVRPGDTVAQDAPVATVLMPEADSALASQAAARNALAVLAKRRAQLMSLQADGLAKASDIAALELEAARLSGEEMRATALLRGAGLSRGGNIVLRSPVAGVVTEVAAIVGELRRPEDGPIARVRSRTGRRIESTLPRPIDASAVCAFRSVGEQEVPVKLLSLVPKPSGAGFTAWFEAADGVQMPVATEGRILVRASFDARTRVVPAAAVGMRAGAHFVVGRASMQAAATVIEVELLQVTANDAVVRGELPPGTLLATDPYRARPEHSTGQAP